jgi:DNA-binding transcriptional LysR family regulator
MSDKLFDMVVFARVVEAGSLSGAARHLGLSLAVVSRTLARLEMRLGVRLANRTTRTLSLTEEGLAFHVRCVRILADVDEAEIEATRGRDTASGLLRITSTFAFSRRRLAPLLQEFQSLHSGLRIHLQASDSLVNLVEGGYDLAVRFGALADSSMIARQLAPNVRVICGAPAYLDRRGRPATVEDLTEHDCIDYGDPPQGFWTLTDSTPMPVRCSLTCNDGELAHGWALQGAGLVLKSIWDAHDDIEAGRLEVVLPKLRLPAAPIHAVYPHSRHAAAKVRLCVDFLADRLRKDAASLARFTGRSRSVGPVPGQKRTLR